MNKLDTKSIKFEIKSIDSESDDYHIIEGYATKWNGIDSYGDTIIRGAYSKTIQENPEGFPAFIMHNSYDMPVGLFYDLEEDEEGLKVKCKAPKKDELVSNRLIPQIKAGSINALSIGFKPERVSFKVTPSGQECRVLEVISLREISFITKGYQADSQALLTSLKAMKPTRSDNDLIFNAMIDAKRNGCTEERKIEIASLYEDLGRSNPFDDAYVISTEELKSLSKSNKCYAIQKCKLSAKASDYLAGLVNVTPDEDDHESEEIPEPPKESPEVKTALTDLINELKQITK